MVSVIGIFKSDLTGVNVQTYELIDIAFLARSIGIQENRKVKAKLTLEVVEEPCELCEKPATGDQLCQKCGKIVCDECAKADPTGRYCPACFGLR